MKFEAYLVTESRRQLLTYEEFMVIAKGRCSDAFNEVVKNGPNLMRGIQRGGKNNSIGGDAGYTPEGELFYGIDPSKFKRVSAYASNNLYTLLMDNHPSWKGYPKRSRSVICGTSGGKAEEYDSRGLYHVLPENGSDVAVSPTSDVWSSFTRVFGNASYQEVLGDFTKSLNRALLFFNKSGSTSVDHSWTSFRKYMVQFDKEVVDYMKHEGSAGVVRLVREEDLDWGHELSDFISKFYKGNMHKALGSAFDPSSNKFTLIKAGQRAPKGREAWTSNYCLMVKEGSEIEGIQL